MAGIVVQLEEEALQEDADILGLLRKAKVVAHKLKLDEFEKWTDCELGGYKSKDEVPEYRYLSGDLKAWNPYHSWIPVVSDGTLDSLKTQPIRDGIATLIDLYGNSEGSIICNFNDVTNGLINKLSGEFPTSYCLIIGKNQLKGVIERDKTIVLEWALALEDDNILGEGLTFTREEKESAANNPTVQNYTNNIYGSVGEFQLQQGTSGSLQGDARTWGVVE